MKLRDRKTDSMKDKSAVLITGKKSHITLIFYIMSKLRVYKNTSNTITTG